MGVSPWLPIQLIGKNYKRFKIPVQLHVVETIFISSLVCSCAQPSASRPSGVLLGKAFVIPVEIFCLRASVIP